MSENMPEGFEAAATAYVASLEQFAQQYNLPAEWFQTPDHLAVKCADAPHFDDTVQAWLPASRQASYVELNNRRLASFELRDGLPFGSFGSMPWLEVMEPRPERVGFDVVGVEHAEFVYPDFAAAEQLLLARGIAYEAQSNPSHQWLNIGINTQGQELKLNKGPLADIVADNVRTGRARYFDTPASQA